MGSGLREKAEAAIRAGIVTGAYRFGERLSDRVLAERLGISRTPVRLALASLADSGLVVVKPQSGTTVMDPDAATIRQCCAMRALLETGALRLAAEADRAAMAAACGTILDEAATALEQGDHGRLEVLDTAFHETLVLRAGNGFLVQAYRAIGDFVSAIRYRLPRDPARYRAALDQHRRIVTHLAAGRLDAAEAELAAHVTRVAAMATGARVEPALPTPGA